jgi:hypothetical protein
VQRPTDIEELWNQLLILAQRVDKLEFTGADFKTTTEKSLTDLKESQTLSVRDEAYRRYDWIKSTASIIGALLIVGCLLWYTLITKVHSVETEVKAIAATVPHLVTKDQLPSILRELNGGKKR